MKEVQIIEDEDIRNKRHCAIVESIFQKICNHLAQRWTKPKFQVYIEDLDLYGNRRFSIRQLVRRNLLKFIPYTKKTILLTFTPHHNINFFYLFSEDIVDITKEAVSDYNQQTGLEVFIKTSFAKEDISLGATQSVDIPVLEKRKARLIIELQEIECTLDAYTRRGNLTTVKEQSESNSQKLLSAVKK